MPSALTHSIRHDYREAREIPINYELPNCVANSIYEGGFQVKVHSLSPIRDYSMMTCDLPTVVSDSYDVALFVFLFWIKLVYDYKGSRFKDFHVGHMSVSPPLNGRLNSRQISTFGIIDLFYNSAKC